MEMCEFHMEQLQPKSGVFRKCLFIANDAQVSTAADLTSSLYLSFIEKCSPYSQLQWRLLIDRDYKIASFPLNARTRARARGHECLFCMRNYRCNIQHINTLQFFFSFSSVRPFASLLKLHLVSTQMGLSSRILDDNSPVQTIALFKL